MEAKNDLTKIKNILLDIFKVNSVDEVFNPMREAVFRHDEQVYQRYIEAVNGDLSKDYLQKVYQYYSADRENLGQDYTPVSLSKLLGQLTCCNDVVDLCAGSGALTIQAWNINPHRVFTCYEIDFKAVTFLLFNLCVRNIAGRVYHQDLFNGQNSKIYQLTKHAEYSLVQEVGDACNY